jgi:diketogulonate reductase-like aldo/keto reductase
MPTSLPAHTLPSGDDLPLVGFGTWDMSDADVRAAVPTALDHGYTHLDAAEGYQNQAAVGEVLATYERDDLFLTSKVLPSNLDYEGVFKALTRTLDRLGTDYLDLYLIHWPNPAVSLRETLHALERAHEQGRIRNVGVSNFGTYELKFAQKIADVPIAVNQFELNPWYYREELLSYCHDHDIVVQAAAPLGRAAVLKDPTITEIADKHDVMPAQVALRWAVEKDVVVLPQSTTPAHIRANLDLFEWPLSDDEHARIDAIDRMENAYYLDLDDPIYGISA